MNDRTIETLARRLDRVERENRQWKAIGISVMAVLGLAFVLAVAGVGQTQVRVEDEIRAKRFVLVDTNGKSIGQLGRFIKDLPWLFLHTEAGEISLLVDADGPRLNMWGKDKRSRVYIKAGDSPRLRLEKPAGVAIWSEP